VYSEGLLENKTRCEQDRQLFASYPLPALVALLLAIVLLLVISSEVPKSLLFAWSVLFVLVMIYRTIVYARYSASNADSEYEPAWRFRFGLGAILLGICWALASIVFIQYLSITTLSVMIILIAGVASGSVVSLAYVIPIMRIYLALVLIPVVVMMAMHDTTLSIISVLAVFFLITLHVGGTRLNEAFTKNIRMKYSGEKELENRERSDRRVKLLIDSSPLATIEWDERMRITSWNRAAQQLFGYSLDTVLESDLVRLVSGDSREVLKHFAYELLYKDKSAHSTIHLASMKSDGTYFTSEWTASVLSRGDEKLQFAAQIRDASEIKQRENELENSVKQHAHILSNLPVVLYSRRAVGDYCPTFISANVGKLLGYDAREFISDAKFWQDKIHPEDRDRVWSDVIKLYNYGKHIQEYRFLQGNGQFIWLRDELNLVLDDAGNPHEIIGSLANVDYEKKTQLVNERFKKILDMMLEGVFVFDVNSLQCIYVNRGAALQSGYSEADLRRMSPVDLLPDITEESYRQLIEPISGRQGRVVSLEAELRHRDGHFIAVEIQTQYIELEDETPHYVAIFRDIQERQKVDVMKNQLVSTISHELRTPLTSILGALGLLRIECDEAVDVKNEVSRLIDIAYNNSKRLVAIVEDVIDIDKAAHGMLIVENTPQSIMPVIRDAIKQNTYLSSHYDIHLQLGQACDEKIGVEVDALRLIQVISNLLSNAAKFSPAKGAVKLSVVAQPTEVNISVCDEGVGIPDELADDIFERFYQVDSSTTRKHNGAGLGLALCKNLVEKMRGKIGFHSNKPNKGVTFFVTLPRLDT